MTSCDKIEYYLDFLCNCEIHDYPLFSTEKGGVLIYKNVKYHHKREVGFRDIESEVIVGRMKDMYGSCFSITVSSLEVEPNIVKWERGWFYVKEGFELPDYKNPIMEKFFIKDYYGNISNKRIIIKEIAGKKLNDIVEEVIPCSFEFWKAMKGFSVGAGYNILGYPYLYYGDLEIREYEGNYYIQLYVGNYCGKVLDEYQDLFRNAINELNNT